MTFLEWQTVQSSSHLYDYKVQFKLQQQMGNSSNKKQLEEGHTEHVRLGNVKLQTVSSNDHEEQQQNYLMNLKRTVDSQKNYKEWLKSMEQISDSQTQEVLFLPHKQSFQPVGLCGSGGIVKLTFEYYQFVLKVEIENRKKLKKDFLETEIWYLLFNIVRAGQKFELFKKKIGNIHPNNILINENGQVKVISSCSLPGELNNYDLLLQSQHDKNLIVFLAPEQINNDLMQKGNYPSHVDPCLAEVFSIGLIILSSGTLQDCDTIYSKNPYQIKQKNLSQLLNIFKDKYSSYLYKIVLSMLALNPQERIKCSSIMTTLAPYEHQIMDLQPFSPPNEQNYRPSQVSGKIAYSNIQNVGYHPPNHIQYVQPHMAHQSLHQAPPYVVYQQQQQGYSQNRGVTYSQPNVVVGNNRGQFR